jgi:hypothetical protein
MREAVPGFLMGTGGGMGLSACSTVFETAVPTVSKLLKQRDSPHRDRVEMVKIFLIFMCFSIRKMESREQRNSVTQASRRRAGGAAGAKACLVLQADGKRSERTASCEMSETALTARQRKIEKTNEGGDGRMRAGEQIVAPSYS